MVNGQWFIVSYDSANKQKRWLESVIFSLNMKWGFAV